MVVMIRHNLVASYVYELPLFGRNTIQGLGANNWDLAVFKAFPISEQRAGSDRTAC